MNIEWDIKIKNVGGGFIIEVPSDAEEGRYNQIVIEERDKSPMTDDSARLDETMAARDLIFRILSAVGYSFSDHSAYNIKVSIEDKDGDEVEVRPGNYTIDKVKDLNEGAE